MLEFSDLKLHKPDKYHRRGLGSYFVSSIQDTKNFTYLLLKVYKTGEVVLSANGAFYLDEKDLDKLKHEIWNGHETWYEKSIETK